MTHHNKESIMANITIRVDDRTKNEAKQIVESLGLDLSSVTRVFYRQIVREHRVPVSLSLQIPTPQETLAAKKEADEILASGVSRYSNLDDMLHDMES
jgi:DNA-damage-inducible protein J